MKRNVGSIILVIAIVIAVAMSGCHPAAPVSTLKLDVPITIMIPDSARTEVQDLRVFVNDDKGTVYLNDDFSYNKEEVIHYICKIASGGKRHIFVDGLGPSTTGVVWSAETWIDASSACSLPTEETILTLSRVK